LLNQAAFACVMVSHDRYFLENVATEIVDLNRVYAAGLPPVKGTYSKFIEGRHAYLGAQSKLQDAIGQLRDVNQRVQTSTAGIDFSATDRQTKRLVEFEDAALSFGEPPNEK